MSLSMKPLRHITLAAVVATASLSMAACKPVEGEGKAGDAKAEAGKDGKAEAGNKIAGLPTEKDQISYMIGMDIGKTLKPIKDEVDLKVLNEAIQDVLGDKKAKLTDEQMMQVAQTFTQKMQEKQQAEAKAKAEKNLADGKKFLDENGKKAGVSTTASGLQYQALTPGTGPKPQATDTVRVHYTGTLLDGTKFDSSYDRKEPVVFSLEQVVPGWKEGLQLMPVGSKYKLWVPGALGYGEAGTPGGPIPPNATLVFEVELLEIVKK
jgi:FKBP-type peptidyl-prolyl cis-trans isomerase FkpA